MSSKSKSKPAESQEQAANNGVSSELSQEIVIAFADYLDVHIEMDLYQKQLNRQRGNEDEDKFKT